MEQKTPTFESVWALFQETAQLQKESEARREKANAHFDERIKKLDKLIDGKQN